MKRNSSQMPRFPWSTEEGYLDFSKVSIDGILKRSLSPDITPFRSACQTLGTMQANGRAEAEVYLVGLFYHFRDDLLRLASIVEHLPKDSRSAQMLIAELYRVKGSNSTRRYLGIVVKTLAGYPRPLIEEDLERLSRDKTLSVRMRAKFEAYLDKGRFGDDFWA